MSARKSIVTGVWSLLILGVLAAGVGVGYWFREATVVALQARVSLREARLAQSQAALVQEEEARLVALRELTELKAQKAEVEARHALGQKRAAETEALLRDQVVQATAVRQELEETFRLETTAMVVSLEGVDSKQSEAFLLTQQGEAAVVEGERDVAADFYAQAAERYGELASVLVGLARQRGELASRVPVRVRLTYEQAATRAQTEVALVRSSVEEYTAGAKLHRVAHEVLSSGFFALAGDIQRWLRLLTEASENLERSQQHLDEAERLSPELERLFQGRRLGAQFWEDYRDEIQQAVEFFQD